MAQRGRQALLSLAVLCFTRVATQSNTTVDQNATAGSQGLGAAADVSANARKLPGLRAFMINHLHQS